jgi:hypothetical protein
MQDDQGPTYTEYDAPAVSTEAVEEKPRARSGPVTLASLGFDVRDIPPSFLRLSSKPTGMRILQALPVPEPIGERAIEPLARFEVELHGSLERRIWDVSSKRAMALLGSLPDVSSWFTVARSGKGTGTTYEIAPLKDGGA